MAEKYDSRLGGQISTHKPSLIYPAIVTIICLPLALGGAYVTKNGGGVAPLILALLSLLFMVSYLVQNRKKRLIIFEHGICLEKMTGAKTVLWRNITKVNITYSYVQDPYAAIDISIRQREGPRLVLNTSWSNRKMLIDNLAFLFSNKS